MGTTPIGKKETLTFCARGLDDPIPLEGKTITFSVGGFPVFRPDSKLHEYWKVAYRGEAFTGAVGVERNGGEFCIVTGNDGQPIADSHKPEIKGVPGLPPKGGYLVSFAREAPALASYGFEGSRNAPVSEQAAAGYALALNDLLRKPFARTINNEFVICSWVRDDPDLSVKVNGVTIDPTDEAVRSFFEDFAERGRLSRALYAGHYHSLTLAANGGRVVVRRWLDEPLREVVAHLERWFRDLKLETIATKFASKPYRAIDVLAGTTARTPADVRLDVYDALYRAALEEGSNPSALLAPILHRLRIAAIRSGSNVRYDASRFALIKLILIRSESSPMTLKPQLCETHDAAYNCGRLLAVLDDIQYAAQGDVGADIVSRCYGNASTFPANIFPRLIRLTTTAHLNKLRKSDDAKKRKAFFALEAKLNEICALFPCDGPGGAPNFPSQLDVLQQGRFALGFYQQKAKDERDRDAYLAANGKDTTPSDTPNTPR